MWFSQWLKIDEANHGAGFASYDFKVAPDAEPEDENDPQWANPFAKTDAFIDKYLNAYKDWKTTPDEIAPGHGGGGWSEFDDLFATLAGRKRAVWLSTIVGDTASQDQKLIVKRSIQRMVNNDPKMAKNLTYIKVFDETKWIHTGRGGFEPDKPRRKYDDIVIGPEPVIDDLRRLLRYERHKMQQGTCNPIPIVKAIGDLLGYHSEAAARYCEFLCGAGTPEEREISKNTLDDSLDKHFRTNRLRFPKMSGFDPDDPQRVGLSGH